MGMQIRPVVPADLSGLDEIDGTIVSTEYLHLDRTGEGTDVSWKLAERPLRERAFRARQAHEPCAHAASRTLAVPKKTTLPSLNPFPWSLSRWRALLWSAALKIALPRNARRKTAPLKNVGSS